MTNLRYTPTRANSKIRIPCTNPAMSDPSLQLVPRHRKIEPRTSAKSVLSRYLRGKPLIEPSVPAAASRAAPPLRNRIDPMEEEGAVGQRSRRSPSPRRSPPAVEGVLVGDEGGDIESRPTHVTWEEWAMSGNDARYDADSAVLVAAESRAPGARQDAMARLLRFSSLGSRSGAGAGGGGCRLRGSVSSCALWQLRPVAASRGTW